MKPFFTRLLVAGGFLFPLLAVQAQPGHVLSSRAAEKPLLLVRPQQLMQSAGAPALGQLLPAAAAKVMRAGAPARTSKRQAAPAGGVNQLALTSGPVSEQWAARYKGKANGSSGATDVAVDAAGNVYVTGYSYASGSYDYATLKYAPSGEPLWEASYNGPGNGDDVPADLTVDAAGNVYVTGYSPGRSSGYDYATIKYSASGQELWRARYNGNGNADDYAFSLAVDGAGNVFVTGGARGSGRGRSGVGSFEYRTLKYSASGQELWSADYIGGPYSTHVATAVALDAAGNACVTGYSYGPSGGYNYATLKYAGAGGQKLWIARYNGPSNGDDVATAVAVDAAGNVYVTGSSENSGRGSNYDYATLKYGGASGQQLWEARYNGPANSHDLAAGLAVDAAGSVFVTGTSDNAGSGYDYATLKYSPTGQQVWGARYNRPANSFDEATGLALDAAGNVYVTGRSYASNGTDDYVTLKYAGTSGEQRWEARYNGPANGFDEAAALAVDATGNVYVTGQSLNSSNLYDYATIKYVQPGESPATIASADRLGVNARPAASAASATGGSRELAVYPNPAAEQATVSFRPTLDGRAQVEVYNQLGQRVATLYEGAVHVGQRYALPLRSQSLAPGVYQCSVTVNGQREQVRLLIAR